MFLIVTNSPSQDLISIHNAENWLGGGLEGAEEGTGGPTGMLIQTRKILAKAREKNTLKQLLIF